MLPPGAPEAVLRLCCALYLRPAGSSGELGRLVQPLAAGGGSSGGAMGSHAEEAHVIAIPDSEEEEEQQPAAGGGSSDAAVHGLGAAVAAALAAAANQQQAAVAAAMAVCQRACGHTLRLLAAAPGSPGLASLLALLLAATVQHSRQQLAVQAAVPAALQAQQPAVQLRLSNPQQAAGLQQAAAALASGLALELLPLPLGSAGALEAQQHRLAAVAEALRWALSNAGLGAAPAAVRQRLAAALEGGT